MIPVHLLVECCFDWLYGVYVDSLYLWMCVEFMCYIQSHTIYIQHLQFYFIDQFVTSFISTNMYFVSKLSVFDYLYGQQFVASEG